MFQSEFLSAIERDQNKSSININHQLDDLMEKLKLLNYETGLLREIRIKPLNRHYFMKTTNPGEQFFVFVSMCAWLIRKTGRNCDQPQEFDEPNAVIAKILKHLQEMDIPIDFPSNKLIQGGGPICVYVLDCLTTQALKIAKNQFDKFEVQQEEEVPVEIMENDSEIILEKVEEEQNAMTGDESDDDKNSMLDLNMKNNNNMRKQKNTNSDLKFDSMIDSENWRLELERVLPQLKVIVKSDARDWRAHLEQMKFLRSNIDSATDDTKNYLKKMENDITYILEKIDSREKHLNNELKNLIQQYKQLSVEQKEIAQLIKENETEKLEKEQELLDLLNELETIKQQTEQRGNTMTDGSPIVNIKKAIGKIKEEISDMDLQIGVLDHTINSEYFKQYMQTIEVDPITTVL